MLETNTSLNTMSYKIEHSLTTNRSSPLYLPKSKTIRTYVYRQFQKNRWSQKTRPEYDLKLKLLQIYSIYTAKALTVSYDLDLVTY